MILHWLSAYSYAQLVMLVGGILIFLGAVITIILRGTLNDKGHQRWAGYAGLVTGACMIGANLLRGKPRYEDLTIGLVFVGVVSSIAYTVLIVTHRTSKPDIIHPSPEPAASSDKIWPPPPTSQQ